MVHKDNMKREKAGNWTRDELIVAFNLYCKTPFGRIHNRNPQIINLASAIGRTPSAVSWKLANFARLDPSLQKRAIAGASHGSMAEIEVWDEFNEDWEALAYKSEQLLAEFVGNPIIQEPQTEQVELALPEGKERETLVRVRVNQSFFRETVFAAYKYRCCITGLSIPELLNASHIIPWSIDTKNRTNPRNGLCLNVLHDRAFDRGLITITPDRKIKVSKQLSLLENQQDILEYLTRYHDKSIRLPEHFLPDPVFLEYHNTRIFKG
jgi:putative restriction endonuclease